MRPPKRSPFLHARHTELLEVYRHLYPDSPLLPSNASSRAHRHTALSLVQLWINRSACPFAVETTALLVQSVILDEHMQQIAAQSHAPPATSSLHYALEQMGGGAELGVRLNYSLALMRFVNSVVDSHQTGGFAQSIAAIAARIGLPQWFVEIRHATTHEELPSISVCRHAARAALAWLHTHFWAPQLFDTRHEPRAARADPSGSRQPADVEFGVSTEPTSSSQEEEKRRSERTKALRELRVTLKDYRELAKKVARDRSLANAAKADMRRLFKQLAMFVSRIRTLEPEFGAQLIERARATKGKDEEADVRQGAQDPDDVDECTKSALADLVNQLLQPGGLVPRSRSKRVSASASGKAMVLPDEVVAVWAPLLAYMRETYGRIFGQILAEELVDVAFRRPALPDDDDTDAEQDASADDPSWQGWKAAAMSYASYGKTAEAWLRYLITTTPVASGAATSNAQAPVGPLVSDVEVVELCLPLQLPASTGLLDMIAERNHELGARIAPLIAVLRVSAFVTTTELDANPGQGDFTSELDVMQTRLDGMQKLFAVDERVADVSMDDTRQTSTNHVNGSAASAMPQGWSAAPSSWKPTPFGCLNGRIPNLVLEI